MSFSVNGHSSLCHLFEITPGNELKETFRKVLGRVQVTVGETNLRRMSHDVNEKEFIHFDEFFQNVDVNSRTCDQFISAMLKFYGVTDHFLYELKIEKAVWSILLENKKWLADHSRYGDIDKNGVYLINMKDDTVYRLFCLYNRFSHTNGNKIRLYPQSLKVIISKFQKFIDTNAALEDDISVFSNFLKYFHSITNPFLIINVKEVYDKYVRDILREGRIKYQVKEVFFKQGSSKTKLGKIRKKLASLTSSYLKIYEDEEDRLMAIEVPATKEPNTRVIHQIKLKCKGCNVDHCGHGFQIQLEGRKKTRTLSCMNYTETGGVGFNLIFDMPKDEAKFYAWNKAVQEAEVLRTNSVTLSGGFRL